MPDEYPYATCSKCGRKFGHPGPCPDCHSHAGASIHVAMEIAMDAHRNQFRKGGVKPPFLIHPMMVLNRLLRWGITETSLLAAMPIHDAVEDGDDPDTISTTIHTRCGPVTHGYVMEMTCVGDKAEYLESFNTKSCGALLGKVADRICNTEDFLHEASTKDYAPKYFLKATPVFTAFFERETECKEKYGENVWEAALDDAKQIANAMYIGQKLMKLA